jgi:hypothetical protein
MSTINLTLGRLLAAAGGALLLASLFMSWAEAPGGASRDGWDVLAATDVLLVVAALLALATALTGGRIGFFRPDVSLGGTADMVGVVTSIVVGWWLLFDVPDAASAGAGGYVALGGAILVACGAGDFRVKSLFPRLDAERAP